MEISTVNTQWTDEQIIDLIRNLRNDLIKDFLDERHLKEFISKNFGVSELSNTQIGFIKKDLKELLIAPVDTSYYEPVITQIKHTDSAELAGNHEALFYKELQAIFKRYIYG